MTSPETKAPATPAGPSPLRRPQSIRRTSSIDTSWPEGLLGPRRMQGRARDLYTPRDLSSPLVTAEDAMEISSSPGREILAIQTSRLTEAARQLIGCRGGGHMRAELARIFPNEQAQGSPLYLLLDDFAGASLVQNWAWSQWLENWPERLRDQGAIPTAGRNGNMAGICAGFRPGSTALRSDGTPELLQSSAIVPPLPHPDDPSGWHELAEQQGTGMRRARRIDVWMEDVIRIDVGFQDSATSPNGGSRIAVHEYHVTAAADPKSFKLLSVEADPRILPYRECPAASANVTRMVGVPLLDLRFEVLERLPGTIGCTHLNDVLRSMADVPQLLRQLSIAC